MKCQKCWKEIPDDSIFCPFCGDTIASRQVSMNDNDQPLNVSSMVTRSIEAAVQDAPTTIKRKKKSWIVVAALCLAVLIPAIWLYSQAAHYMSPFPQLNAACAKYISDYHNLRIGMSYSEVKRILSDRIIKEGDSDGTTFIITNEKINFGESDSDYEVCAFQDDTLVMVWFVFEDTTYELKTVDEHFGRSFGDAYQSNNFDHGSYVGNYLVITTETSDIQRKYFTKDNYITTETIKVFFQSP